MYSGVSSRHRHQSALWKHTHITWYQSTSTGELTKCCYHSFTDQLVDQVHLVIFTDWQQRFKLTLMLWHCWHGNKKRTQLGLHLSAPVQPDRDSRSSTQHHRQSHLVMLNDNRLTDNRFETDNRFQKSKTDYWIFFTQLYVFVHDRLFCNE